MELQAPSRNTDVLGVVLAGGRASRFGRDKALALLEGKTLLEQICARAAPQVARLVVNRNGDAQIAGGFAQLEDGQAGEGPLAGILAALAHAETLGLDLVATFPCDTPFLPRDLVGRLRQSAMQGEASLYVPRSDGADQFACGLWRTSCRAKLAAAFAGGVRSIRSAASLVPCRAVAFPPGEGPDGDAFFNINSPGDLARAEAWLARQRKASPS